MKHPSRYCAEGFHLLRVEVRPGVKLCVWCGETRRIPQPPAPVTVGVNPQKALDSQGKRGETAQPAVAGVVGEIETRFQKSARKYATTSEHLQNWVNAGNKLPKVYL